MSNLSQIKAASCMLDCAGIKGSGFFISPALVLTCLHNIKIGEDITGERPGNPREKFIFELIDAEEALDLALLKLIDGAESQHALHICALQPVPGISWEVYGYPDTTNGREFGDSLSGTIRHFAEHTGKLQHDVVLNVNGYNTFTSEYGGYSGSPLVDDYGNAVAILRFAGHNSLDAVSIKRSTPFLKKNSISFKQDYLLDFEEYVPNCFAGFEDDPKKMCNIAATGVKAEVQPDAITRDLLGKLYYPHKNGNLEEIVAELKKNPATNRGLWKGWLELLSYISMIPSDRPDFNSVTVTLSSETFKELFGDVRDIASDTIEVKINFFWTQGTAYGNIIMDYAHNKLNKEIGNNTCYVFNSADAGFGQRPPKAGFKKGIVPDISGLEDAGPHIVRQMNFGMLSLNQLANEVLACDDLIEARPRIEQLFINALQNE